MQTINARLPGRITHVSHGMISTTILPFPSSSIRSISTANNITLSLKQILNYHSEMSLEKDQQQLTGHIQQMFFHRKIEVALLNIIPFQHLDDTNHAMTKIDSNTKWNQIFILICISVPFCVVFEFRQKTFERYSSSENEERRGEYKKWLERIPLLQIQGRHMTFQ